MSLRSSRSRISCLVVTAPATQLLCRN